MPIGLSIPTATAQEIDKARGKISRSVYIRDIIEKGLEAVGAEGAVKQNNE